MPPFNAKINNITKFSDSDCNYVVDLKFEKSLFNTDINLKKDKQEQM